MTVNLSLHQHRLIVDDDGAILNAPNDSFLIFDSLSQTTVSLPITVLNEVVPFLAQKPAVVFRETGSTSEVAGVLPSEASASDHSASSSSASLLSSDHSTCPSSSTSSASPCEIWIKNSGKPSTSDLEAREDLINLVKSEKYQKLLKDKKTTKKVVFEEISKELLKKGYSFGDRSGWKVCHQKWKNMEAETLRIIAAAGPKNTGGGQVKKPDYFDEVFDIVKDTAKACPKNLQDSLPLQKEEIEVDSEASCKEEGNTSSPFLKVKATSKPKEKRVDPLDVLTFMKAESQKRDKQSEDFLKFLKKKPKEDDKRKKSFLSVLQSLVGSKKRKKSSSEEESSSSSSDGEASD